MSLRWRNNGDLLCAAKCDPQDGDTYIDDRLHYQLSVLSHAILPAADEPISGKWYWVADYCEKELRAASGVETPDRVVSYSDRAERSGK